MRPKRIWVATGIAFLLGVSLSVQGQGVLTQHTFMGTPDGANPMQLAWTNNLFYGSTSAGGTNGEGSLFTFNTNGSVFTTIYSFTNSNGSASPNNVLATASTIYGTTDLGGSNNLGMIYAVGVNGTGFVPLYNFNPAPDGFYPKGGLVLSGATLYGTANNGGTVGGGAIFKINTDGSGYSTLHIFTNTPDGLAPESELVLGGNMLYGTTAFGGANNKGTIFTINTNGNGNTYSVLYSFTNMPDAIYPYGGLVLSAGVLYGISSSGGTNNTGAIFAINTNGNGYKVLYSLSSFGGPDGTTPRATLTLSGNYLYGAATSGGVNGGGTLFLINTNGSGFTAIASFTNSADSGWDPLGSVIRVGNSIWGTANQGGVSTYGTIFRLLLPAITQQPQSLTVTNTSPATFTVNVADDSQLSYQWYFNTNTLLAGQTTNVFTLASATNNNQGTYTVVVSDNFRSVTSSPAVLTVVVPGTKPTITQNPQPMTVLSNSTASFTNAATGTGTLYYQWYFNTNTLLTGQTNTILVIPSASPTQAGYYSVVVTNLYGNATSTPALLTVISPTRPTITQQPQDYTVTNGLTATFTNAATGTGQLFYQWYFNTNTPVNGGTGAILTLAPATTNNAGYYQVVVTNLYGSATSSPALLTVIVPPSIPNITQQPQNYTVTNGYDATFTNTASGTGPLFYQWYFNTNTAVSGGTNSILLLTFATTNQVGSYRVIVTNVAGGATSSPASLAVISTKPLIFAQPQPLTVTNGQPFSFTVLAAGQNPLRYQWYTNTISPAFALAGMTNSTLAFAAATNKLAGNYLVVITNQLGKATSNPALLTVLTKPVITLNPQNVVVTNGDPATFTSAAIGIGTLNFQWFFRTNILVTGATNTMLTFTNAITNLAGFYSVRVTNTFGSVTSTYALLTISNKLNFLSFNFNPTDGSASFAVANIAKSTNRLWASTNLTSPAFWNVIASNIMATNGLWFYTETNSAKTNNARFYRFSNP